MRKRGKEKVRKIMGARGRWKEGEGKGAENKGERRE